MREGERGREGGGEVGGGNDVRDKERVTGIFLAGLAEKAEEEMEMEKGRGGGRAAGERMDWLGLVA